MNETVVIKKQVGDYLNGVFVKEKGISKIKIQTEPIEVTGVFGEKLECKISFEGQTEKSPHKWTMNKKSRNILIDKFGNDTMKWVGKIIPIETAQTEKGRAIYVDVDELDKLEQNNPTQNKLE